MKISIPKKVLTIRELAEILGKDETEILFLLLKEGVVNSINDNIDNETAILVAEEMGFEIAEFSDGPKNDGKAREKSVKEKLKEIYKNESNKDLKPRPPVVTVMGHVDHGKTTLLDRIREAKVAEKEAGGITQSIGAYQVETSNGLVTFIDTPGHEAFSVMRERGAQATDAVILVVAANDGVREQTVEAINLAKDADVPIIIAINKIDLPNANIEKVKEELAKHGLIPESWGGNTQFVEISAKKNINIKELLDLTALITEMKELNANPNGEMVGVIIESRLDPQKGVLASAIILNGTIGVGDKIKAGKAVGKVRFLEDSSGSRIMSATPSTPVQISGLKGMPDVGDLLTVNINKKTKAARDRTIVVKSIKEKTDASKEKLSLIVKADTEGSLDALESVLESLETEKVVIHFAARGVGQINENNIHFAENSNSSIIGFNVNMTQTAQQAMKSSSKKPTVLTHKIIYRLSKAVEDAMKILEMPDEEEKIVGDFSVLKVFRAGKRETLVGGKISQGEIRKKATAKLVRKGKIIASGFKIKTIKNFGTEVKVAESGKEYGIVVKTKEPAELQIGDILRVSVVKPVDKSNPFKNVNLNI